MSRRSPPSRVVKPRSPATRSHSAQEQAKQVGKVAMGRIADALAAVRTPEKLAAAAKMMEQIKSLSATAAADAPKSTAAVFSEPFFLTLKGESMLGKMAWFQNYHKAHFVGGTGRPLVHACLLIGTIGYTIEYVYHLQYQRHGVRDAHGHGDHANGDHAAH